MNTKQHHTLALLSVITIALFLTSCKKESAYDGLVSANNSALADESYNDVNSIADEAATTGGVNKTDDGNSLLSGCATVTLDTVSMPHTCTIDFGSGCTGIDGRTRSGIVLVTFDGRYRDAGTTITITFNNYFVNGNQVLGSKTIVNEGLNADNNYHYSVNVNGSVVLASGAGTISWTSVRDREWTEGYSTPDREDDVYSITGSGSGIAADGDEFSATILSPLVRKLALGCRRHFVSGQVQLQRTGRPTRVIDFGNGACDDQATVTVNGNTHTITLHH